MGIQFWFDEAQKISYCYFYFVYIDVGDWNFKDQFLSLIALLIMLVHVPRDTRSFVAA